MQPINDTIVIGAGSMGAAACYYLAKKGMKVLGIEQFSLLHEFGSHHGQSRIIRKAYFEHPAYVPLLQRAYANWDQLEKESGEQIYFPVGLAYYGEDQHLMMRGVRYSSENFHIPLQQHPGILEDGPFRFPHAYDKLFEPGAGYLLPEKCLRLYAGLAKKAGAEIHTGEMVLSWTKHNAVYTVKTNKAEYRAAKLVVCSGAWTTRLLPSLPVTVTRQTVAWIKAPVNKAVPTSCWMIADSSKGGCFYGFPVVHSQAGGPAGLKIAHHYPGEAVNPETVDRRVQPADLDILRYVLEHYLPGLERHFIESRICLYSNTPDENFIVDRMPGDPDILIAAGFSGHGFKFASVIGELMALMAAGESTGFDLDFLSASRFTP